MPARAFASSLCTGLQLAVFAVCAVKLATTVAIWKEKTNKMSALEILELASSILTDWMWTVIAAYAIIHYISCRSRANSPARRRGTSSTTSSEKSGSTGSSKSSGDSGASRISATPTSISIVCHRTNIPNATMERFLSADEYQFEADMGRMEGMQLLDPVADLYLRRNIPGGVEYRG